MADDLDDFFAKKDSKKTKKSKSNKFTVDDILKQTSDTKKKSEKKKEKEKAEPKRTISPDVLSSGGQDQALLQMNNDAEWEDFERKQADYSGLRIQSLQLGREDDDEEKEGTSGCEEGEDNKSAWQTSSTPWSTAGAEKQRGAGKMATPTSADSDGEDESGEEGSSVCSGGDVHAEESASKSENKQEEEISESDVPPVSDSSKPSSGAYVPPHVRAAGGVSTPSSTSAAAPGGQTMGWREREALKRRGQSTTPLDIKNEEMFPSLSAASQQKVESKKSQGAWGTAPPPPTGLDAGFERVKYGSKWKDSSSNSSGDSRVSASNRYEPLRSSGGTAPEGSWRS